MDDGNHAWTQGPVIPFEITVTNTGSTPITGLELHDVVPIDTVFRPGDSTPGWRCPAGPDGGNLCTFAVGNLGVGVQRVLTFTVQVATGTPSSWDVHNEVGVILDGTASASGVAATVRRRADSVAASAEANAEAGEAAATCLLPVLRGQVLRCAPDGSEAAEAACFEEYEKYLLDAGADTATLRNTCRLARIGSVGVVVEK